MPFHEAPPPAHELTSVLLIWKVKVRRVPLFVTL